MQGESCEKENHYPLPRSSSDRGCAAVVWLGKGPVGQSALVARSAGYEWQCPGNQSPCSGHTGFSSSSSTGSIHRLWLPIGDRRPATSIHRPDAPVPSRGRYSGRDRTCLPRIDRSDSVRRLRPVARGIDVQSADSRGGPSERNYVPFSNPSDRPRVRTVRVREFLVPETVPCHPFDYRRAINLTASTPPCTTRQQLRRAHCRRPSWYLLISGG
jgi:hypothetical protein